MARRTGQKFIYFGGSGISFACLVVHSKYRIFFLFLLFGLYQSIDFSLFLSYFPSLRLVRRVVFFFLFYWSKET